MQRAVAKRSEAEEGRRMAEKWTAAESSRGG